MTEYLEGQNLVFKTPQVHKEVKLILSKVEASKRLTQEENLVKLYDQIRVTLSM